MPSGYMWLMVTVLDRAALNSDRNVSTYTGKKMWKWPSLFCAHSKTCVEVSDGVCLLFLYSTSSPPSIRWAHKLVLPGSNTLCLVPIAGTLSLPLHTHPKALSLLILEYHCAQLKCTLSHAACEILGTMGELPSHAPVPPQTNEAQEPLAGFTRDASYKKGVRDPPEPRKMAQYLQQLGMATFFFLLLSERLYPTS